MLFHPAEKLATLQVAAVCAGGAILAVEGKTGNISKFIKGCLFPHQHNFHPHSRSCDCPLPAINLGVTRPLAGAPFDKLPTLPLWTSRVTKLSLRTTEGSAAIYYRMR